MSCPHKYLFGVPNTGFHSYRIFGLALGDILGTVLLAWLTSYLTETDFIINLVSWFVIGEVMHWYFGTPTAFLKLVGIKPRC